MNQQQKIDQFAKLAAYILGRHPDEFALVLDENGFIKIKEFIKAVTEIDGWKHIRPQNINELMLISKKPTVETDQSLIRASDREHIPRPVYCESPPKCLYICIKQKSYQPVIEKGIYPTFFSKVICAKDKELAEKIGRRRSNEPVLLTIHTVKAIEKDIKFYQYGEFIYLTGFIPADCFTGPPLPKEMPKEKHGDQIDPYRQQAQAGSFMWSPDQPDSRKNKAKKGINWKKDKKRLRKEKNKFWPG